MNTATRLPLYLRIIGVVVAVYLIAPLLVIIPVSFTGKQSFEFPPKEWSLDYYVKFFTDDVWMGALRNSLVLAVVVAIVATVLGTLASFALVRVEFRGRELVRTVLLTPMMVPSIVAAVAVYAVALRTGLVGNFGGFVLAHTMLALPFVIVAVTASLGTFDTRLEHAASSLGANKFTTFRLVTLPLLLPGMLSGAVFAFVTSFDEVVMALYLQSPSLRTLPVQMYTSVKLQTDPTIAAASTVIVVITSAAILLPQLLRKADKS
ncbi:MULTISPECIES: ABC transporter permease [unclassified Salinibacterium]|uniref:ABC transporter permease n=1 Tax=unclassified Salinibacterium TaxID=2632331 RepID=UPI00141F96D8|nr:MULTISPECIES: ABC transporter permease [unclassified Salinibacterium]